VGAPSRTGRGAPRRAAPRRLLPGHEKVTRLGYAAKSSAPRGDSDGVETNAARQTAVPARLVAGPRESPRCSFAQEQFWFVDQLAPGNVAYNFSWPIRLRGALDVSALERAFAEVVRRHESLRTGFALDDGRPVQVIGPDDVFALAIVDLSAEGQSEEAAQRLVDEESSRPFDLSQAGLFRARLIRLSESDHILQIVVHHIVFDEWSKVVLYRELGALYNAFLEGRSSPLPEPQTQYAEFADWQRSRLTDDHLQSELAHWTSELVEVPTVLELPSDRVRPPVASLRGARLRLPLPEELTKALEELAESEGASFFDCLLALFEVLLYRYTGEPDFVVGVPSDDRTRPELDDTIGVLLSTVVLRSDLSDSPTFRDLVQRVRRRVHEAAAHAELPFELLVRELQPVRDLSRHPLFQVLLAINPPDPSLELAGVEATEMDTEATAAGVDLFLFVQERADGFEASWEYSTDLFDRQTIERMHAHFVHLLQAVVASPDTRIDELPLVSESERRQILLGSHGAEEDYPALPLHALVEAQAKRSADDVAVVFEGERLTYAELNARANQVARRLQAAGAGKESLVAVSLERSLDLVISLLAVLKAGAGYVPLDPELPPERLSFMLADSKAKVLLSEDGLLADLPPFGGQVICLDLEEAEIALENTADLEVDVDGDDVAYVIYTSGSTGRPKAVLNTHRGIVNRLMSMQDTYRLDRSDRLLQKTQSSFDVSVREFFWPLIFGARVVLAKPGEHGNPTYLAEVIEREEITIVHFVPSMLQLFLEETDPARLRSVRCVLSGGESLPLDLMKRFFATLSCELHNLYGPTEAAVSVTTWQCRPDDTRPVVPLGHPVANTQIYVVDSRLELVPVGVWGELLIGGAQVARGYLDRPELTADRFVANPFGAGHVYRTGDLGRWAADGALEFGGRIDSQVKVRGFRIELGEIETVLREHTSVAESAVVAVESAAGRGELAAYVVLEPTSADESSRADVHSFLRAKLPDYMVPASITFLERLPLTPSGKLDRKALPAPDKSSVQDEFVEPELGSETELAALWSELLEVERVGRNDNFFALGGHSLLAVRLVGRVGKQFDVDLPLCVFLQEPTVAALAREIKADDREPEPELPPLVARAGVRECSFAQERFWFVDQVMGSSAAYNIPVGLRLRGGLQVEALEAALSEIVRRHEILRTHFAVEDGRPVQIVEPLRRVSLALVDLTELGDSERQREVQRLVDEQTQAVFDLTRGPLFELQLFRLDKADHVLHMVFNHLVFDGWSKVVLFRELAALYDAFVNGRPSFLPEPGLQYADFAEWQRSWLQGELLEKELAHWKESLAGMTEALELPTDRPRPPVSSMRGAWSRCTVPAETVAGLQALARREGATFYVTLLAVFDVLLHRYSGQDDIVLGMPVDGRDRVELEGLIGDFVDTVVLRVDVSGNLTFRELLDRVRARMVDAIAHQRLPFEQLVRALEPDRQLGRHPLYQVMLTLVPADGPMELAGLEVEEIAAERVSSPIDLTVFLEQRDNEYEAIWEYSTDLFERETIERMQGHFLQLLGAVVAEPDRPVGELEMLSQAERQQALAAWDSPAIDYPVGCLHELFEQQVAATPDAPAATYEGETLTYRELNRRANRLARRLRELGVGPETLVALCLERSLEIAVGILAVLKAGGAYVPLDPDYPADRLAFVLADAGPRVLLTQERLVERMPAHEATVLYIDGEVEALAGLGDADLEALARPENLAYVIYTSGSTGKPKGVQVEHRQVARLMTATDDWFGFGTADTWLLFHSYAFDFSVWEFWGALLYGGRLVIAPHWTTRSPQALAELLVEERVTVLNATPTLFVSAQDDLIRAGTDLALRVVVFGGEALRPSALKPWFRRFGLDGPRLVNMYGITETTVHVTYRELAAADFEQDVSPIGQPIPDLQIYLLDDHLNPVPPGVPGELFVGGAGVARGYLNRPELNSERFLQNPFGSGRLYRSGDSALYREDGELEFLGRLDDQVKIRGFRIELGEIQAAVSDHEGVAECAVVPFEAATGDTRLAAYVVPAAETAGAVRTILRLEHEGEVVGPTSETAGGRWTSVEQLRGDLRAHLEGRLPDFMVPASLTLLPMLPLTANGKLDRKSLPPPVWDEHGGGEFVAPRTPIELAVAEIWQGVLGVDRVGVDDNFFHLGGHSLLAARVVTQVRARFTIDISVRALFEDPTLGAFAAKVSAAGGEAPEEAQADQPATVERTYPPSFSQQQLLVIDELAPELATYNGAFAVRVSGDLDSSALEAAVSEVLTRHEALRTVFKWDSAGPVQVVLDRPQPTFLIVDLTSLRAEEREAELQRLLRVELRRPFDLGGDVMLRTTLFKLAADEHALLVVTHHIASDGWSVNVFRRDLSELYNARRAGRSPQLPDLPLQYRDFVLWQRGRLSGEQFESEREYWRGQLAGARTILDLPTDRPRSAQHTFEGVSYPVILPREVAEDVLRLCRETESTPYVLLLSVFGLLLYRLTGQDDILIGGPFANRSRTEFDHLIGFFANTMVMRARLSGNPPFTELLGRVGETVLEALDHQEFPFERVVDAVRPERRPGMNPLVQVNFRTTVDPPATLELDGATTSNLPIDSGFAAFDLALDLRVLKEGITGEFIYDTELFDPESVERIAADFAGLLRQILERPETRLLAFELPSEQAAVASPTARGSIRRFRQANGSGAPPRSRSGGQHG
jgi:amino acid adenylation domain-containing protein